MKKRKEFKDSEIMDALDASEMNVSGAARRLGVMPGTLSKWILEDENLKKYVAFRNETDAVKARDRLSELLDRNDIKINDLISACKILLDKAEPDKKALEVDGRISIDHKLSDDIDRLFGGD